MIAPELVLAVSTWVAETFPKTLVGTYDLHTGRSVTSQTCYDPMTGGIMEIIIRNGLPEPLTGLDVVFGREYVRLICWSENEHDMTQFDSFRYYLADPDWAAKLEEILGKIS